MALGVLLAVLTARYKHFLVVPATLVVSIAGFYAVLWLTGTSLAQASAHDWLLGPFSQGYRWPPLAPSQIPEINWAVLGQEMGLMLSLLLVGTISLLLNETGLELALHRDTSLDQDLRAHGWANLLSGLLGGAPGYTSLSISLIGPRMRVGRRVAPLVVAFMAGATLLVGANSLSYLPRFTLAGLAFFLGLSLLIEWVYSTWFSLPRLDWVLLMLILAVIITSGLLVGIGVGLIVAMVLFIVRYSRVGVVKNTLDGQSFVSNRQRLLRHERLLREHGASLYILRLQNYLFFGTADGLVTQIRHRVDDTGQPPVKFVVLDFQRVVGMDSSAVLGFVRLQQITSERGIFLVLTHIEDALLRELKLGGQILEGEDVRIFPDLDRGVEWCENQTLAALGEADAREFTFADELAQYLPATIAPPRLLAYMERREVAASETIMRQGEAADKLYLIGAGQATVLLRLPDGNEIRLWTMEPGTWVGEMGFYLGRLRSASVVADEPVTVYSLSRAGLERMQAEDADLAMAFHEMLARVLAERLANTDRMMVGLLA
ncbi:MAG: SulP family inorganic anion transporter [Anaerolineae bacterium]